MEAFSLWSSPAKAVRWAHIDALRAAAVLLVAVSHAGLQDVVPGAAGVTIFLSISGFIITYLVLRERAITGSFSARRFYLRRALKLAPPFVVIILIPTAIYAACGGAVSGSVIAAQVFFVFNWVAAFSHDQTALPGSGVLWSLAVEEQFYIVFAIYWIFASRRQLYVRYAAAFGFTAILVSFVSRIIVADGTRDSIRINYGTDTRMEAIGWGVLVAVLYFLWQQEPRRFPGLRRAMACPMIPAGAALLFLTSLVIREQFFRDTLRYTAQSWSACAFMLFGLVSTGRMRQATQRICASWLVWTVGLASYSIYLVHDPAYAAIEHVTGRDITATTAIGYVAVGVALGIVVYKVVEVPFENVRAHLHRDRRELPQTAMSSNRPSMR